MGVGARCAPEHRAERFGRAVDVEREPHRKHACTVLDAPVGEGARGGLWRRVGDDLGAVHDLALAAEGARDLGAVAAGAEGLGDGFGLGKRTGVVREAAVRLQPLDAFEHVDDGLGAEAGERGQRARGGDGFEVFEARHVELLPHRADLLGAQPFDAEHLGKPRRQALQQVFVERHRTRFDHLADIGGEPFADAAHGRELLLVVGGHRLVHAVDGARGGGEGAGAEGVAAGELQEVGGEFELAGDGLVRHGSERRAGRTRAGAAGSPNFATCRRRVPSPPSQPLPSRVLPPRALPG